MEIFLALCLINHNFRPQFKFTLNLCLLNFWLYHGLYVTLSSKQDLKCAYFILSHTCKSVELTFVPQRHTNPRNYIIFTISFDIHVPLIFVTQIMDLGRLVKSVQRFSRSDDLLMKNLNFSSRILRVYSLSVFFSTLAKQSIALLN